MSVVYGVAWKCVSGVNLGAEPDGSGPTVISGYTRDEKNVYKSSLITKKYRHRTRGLHQFQQQPAKYTGRRLASI